MIKLENTEVFGWKAAIRGMRNPMNSWDKSDTTFPWVGNTIIEIGPNDYELMKKLAIGGGPHAKYRRMIDVTVDIIAPLYWWKEFDTYKIATVANSCSTMHKIHSKEFTRDDFSYEHLMQHDEYIDDIPTGMIVGDFKTVMDINIKALNDARELYLKTKDKRFWWQMIQLLPSSYNQKRTVQLNYENLSEMYKWRKEHKLDEWRQFCNWIKTLPYSEFITGEYDEVNNTKNE